MLEREDGRGCEQGDLLAVHDRLERGAHRHFGLAVSDVAAEQTIHRGRQFHVAFDVDNRRLLVGSEVPFEGVLELLLPVGIGAEGVPGYSLPGCIELQQLLGHVAHGLLDTRLGLFPRRPAKPVEAGTGGPRKALHQIEALHGNEQLVVGRVAELHELLRVGTHFDSFQPDEDADAVIDVHDEVANLEIAEVREERPRGRLPAVMCLPLLFEDVRLGPQLQASLRESEALRQIARADEHRGALHIFGTFDGNGQHVVVPEELHRSLAHPGRVRHQDDGVATLARAPDVRHPVLNPAAELDSGLAGDVDGLRIGSGAGDVQRVELGCALQPLGHLGPVDKDP